METQRQFTVDQFRKLLLGQACVYQEFALRLKALYSEPEPDVELEVSSLIYQPG